MLKQASGYPFQYFMFQNFYYKKVYYWIILFELFDVKMICI